MSSILPQNPWAVTPGLYFRTNGQIVNLSGPSHFWEKKDSNQGATPGGDSMKQSMECHAGNSDTAGEKSKARVNEHEHSSKGV
jgi:hypothetical protein